MPDCTSRAAPSMLRSSPNCSTIWAEPWPLRWELWEVISVRSAMEPRVRSSGVATLVAITSGLAPGRLARTTMVGKSTWGSGATGSTK